MYGVAYGLFKVSVNFLEQDKQGHRYRNLLGGIKLVKIIQN